MKEGGRREVIVEFAVSGKREGDIRLSFGTKHQPTQKNQKVRIGNSTPFSNFFFSFLFQDLIRVLNNS